MKRKVPRLTSDEAAEAFLDQDLSDLDFSQFKHVDLEALLRSTKVDLELPELLLAAVKEQAEREGISYQRFILQALKEALAQREPETVG